MDVLGGGERGVPARRTHLGAALGISFAASQTSPNSREWGLVASETVFVGKAEMIPSVALKPAPCHPRPLWRLGSISDLMEEVVRTLPFFCLTASGNRRFLIGLTSAMDFSFELLSLRFRDV